MTLLDPICSESTSRKRRLAAGVMGAALLLSGCSSDTRTPAQTTGVSASAGGSATAITSTGAESTGGAGPTATTGASTASSSTSAQATATTTDSTTGAATTTGANSSTSAGSTGGIGGGGSLPDPVACSTPLAERVTVTTIAVSPAVDLENGQSWGSTGLPVMLSASPNGQAKVAWTDGESVHVTPLSAAGERAGDDILVPGSEVRGLVAHDDGAALLVRQDDQMVFLRLDAAGATLGSLIVVGDNSHTSDGDRWIDDWPHNGRLAWSGAEYAAYFGQTGNHGAAGDHQGDHYAFISPDGVRQAGGWDWGCSHSLDVRLAHNGSVFAPICTSDTYPGAGIWFNNREELSDEPSITNVGGGTKLGGLVPAPDGFWLDFASPEQRSSYDVVFVHIDNEGNASGRVVLTDTPDVDERFAHLAAYGDGLLAGWGSDTDITLAVLDTTGSVLEGPVAVSARAGGLDDFASYPSGDVGWAFAENGDTSLQIARVARCE